MLLHLKRNHPITKEPAAVHLPYHKPLSVAISRTSSKNQLQISKSNQLSSKRSRTIYGKCSAIGKWHN